MSDHNSDTYGLWAIDHNHPDGGSWATYQGRTISGPRDEIGRFVLGDGAFEAHPLPVEITDTISVTEWRSRAVEDT